MNTKINNVLVAPDKFKGTLSAEEFCEIATLAFREKMPDVKVVSCPLADGGEGSLQCFVKQTGAKLIEGDFSGSNFEKKKAYYALNGSTAFIEVAQTCSLVGTKIKNPSITTTLGVGEQIVDAIEKGATTIYLAVGGSSTNDAGCGMAAALGYKFVNMKNESFVPTGGCLNEIKEIVFPTSSKQINFVVLCDVKNVLYGKNGAAYVYAKQKGATPEQIEFLDRNLKYFSELCMSYKTDYSFLEGSGAAGGLGFGAKFFLNAKIESGVQFFFNLTRIEEKIRQADLIVSGEGKIDDQSKSGKLVFALKEKCGDKKFVAFCGENKSKQNFFPIYEINKKEQSLSQAMKNTKINLRNRIMDIIDYL